MSREYDEVDNQAERGLLGAALLSGMAAATMFERTWVDCFGLALHRLIYGAMKELYDNDDSIDVITVADKLRETDTDDRTGAVLYLLELQSGVPAISHALDYANIVRRGAEARR